MAFHDWNNDGKKDIADDYIEYNIYKESTKNNNTNNCSGNFGCGASGWIMIILMVLLILSKCGS